MTSLHRAGPADVEVLARVAAGDEAALELLHTRYGGVVFGFVSARMADRSSAEEVAADVWLGCWRSAGAFRGDSQVLTWLLGIAKRQVGSHTRRKHVPQVPFDVDRHDVTAADLDPAELVASAHDAATVVAALRTLPPELAEVVRLAWVHELPYAEIASLVGVPAGTVKSRVWRARGLLREQLRSNDD